MLKLGHHLILCIIFLLSSISAFADDPTPAQIDILVQKLGSESFRERESAQRELTRLGEDILPHLRKAASQTTDAEIRERLQSIIKTEEEKACGLIKSIHTEGSVITASLSADGKILVSIGYNGVARFWDVATEKHLRDEKLYALGLQEARFSPDGKTIVITGLSDGGAIKILETSSNKITQKFSGPKAGVFDLNWSKDGKLMISAGNDSRVRLWDVSTGKELMQFSLTDFAYGADISPDGKQIVGCSSTGEVRLWDASDGKLISEFQKLGNRVRRVRFSPDGKIIATASYDKLVHLLDVESGKELRFLAGHSDVVCSIQFSSDSSRVLTGSFDHTMSLWETATGKLIHVYTGHTQKVSQVNFSADGRTAISASVDGDVNLWRVPK